MTTVTLPLGDVLSVTTGALVSRDHIGGVYNVCDKMTGTAHFTHQLPRASKEITPVLLAQHPELGDVEVPRERFAATPDSEIENVVYGWLSEMEALYGTDLEFEAIDSYVPRDPFGELLDMMESETAVPAQG